MKNKLIKVIVLGIVCVCSAFATYVIAIIAFEAITNPTVSLKSLDKPMDYEIISAKQIEAYLSEEIKQIDKLDKYDLTIGSIDMKIDREHRGEVIAIFVEKEPRNSKLIFAKLDTNEGIFYKFEDYGRESKLYPGIVNLRDWNIDSIDAVRIAEEVFNKNEDFQYDKVGLHTYSDSLIDKQGSTEEWHVELTDTKNNIRYDVTINPYSGEVVSHYKNEK